MNTPELEQVKNLRIDAKAIPDEVTRADVALLLRGIESLASKVNDLEEENQNLKDEINRLKGEQGKPKINPQTGKDDHSSEGERSSPENQSGDEEGKGDEGNGDSQGNKNNEENKDDQSGQGKAKAGQRKKSKSKKHKISAHETRHCPVDKSILPEDAEFKGYDSVVIQGIVVRAHNVEYRREVYYSPSMGRRFIADLPPGSQGEFSPELKAFIIACHHDYQMTEPAIRRMLTDVALHISPATISRILTGVGGQSSHTEIFQAEKQDIVSAGMQSSDYQQTDDTSARVSGKNHYTHVLCNPFYTAYFTRPKKDRLTVLEILNRGPLSFSVTEEALRLMQEMEIPEKYWSPIETFFNTQKDSEISRSEIDVLLSDLFPDSNKHHKNRQIILEACALTAYRNKEDAIKILVCDDAPQFKNLTEYLALCWIHEGRHYKKLRPFMAENQEKLTQFLKLFWEFYHKLLAYKAFPSLEKAQCLETQFDTLFCLTTGYEDLDARIAKTFAKKENLLLVLKYPNIPLHNNASELGARRQARYRDISLHTKTDQGTYAKDDMMSIGQTARKLGVSVYHYMLDRVARIFAMPSLASLIATKAAAAATEAVATATAAALPYCDTG